VIRVSVAWGETPGVLTLASRWRARARCSSSATCLTSAAARALRNSPRASRTRMFPCSKTAASCIAVVHSRPRPACCP
jgi:hypothetical protein